MSIENALEETTVSAEKSLNKTERLWAMIAHFCILLPIIPCLIIYWIFKNQSRFVAFHALQALKLQVVFVLILFVIPFILFPDPYRGPSSPAAVYAYCTFPILMGTPILGLIAGIEAVRGKLYKYPLYSDKWV